ncbi:MAG: hypothetical protein PHR22_02050 [Candidatus Omnitrophica bacterium]|nr:hypothetical protein [Candidatus Omnitrophota bacterium]
MKKYVLCAGAVCCVLLFAGTAAAISPVETKHFRVVDNGEGITPADLKAAGDTAESLYKEVTNVLGTEYTSSGKIEIRVYVTPKSGRGLRPAASGSSLYLTLGKIDEEILRQGIAHIIISKPLSSAPRWFLRGLELYVAYGSMSGQYRGLPPFDNFTFARLEQSLQPGKGKDASYYSWAVVSYVMDNYGKDRLKTIYKQSGTFSDKFSKAFGVDLKSLEKKSGEIFAAYR